jgi:hypothetical protein
MKTQLSSSLRAAVIASTLFLLPTFVSAKVDAATDRAKAVLALHGSLPVTAAGPYVQIGTYKIQVSVKLGQPSAKLPDGTWLYRNFTVDDSEASGALLVSFEKGRVSGLTIVTPEVALALTTPAKPGAKSLVAANK